MLLRFTLLLASWLACCCFVCSGRAVAQIADLTDSELVERLEDSDVDRRRDAAYELVRRASKEEGVVQAFAKAISDKDDQVRFQALLGLARMGSDAAPATPALIEQLKDRSDQIRFRAADALGKIGPSALPALVARWPEAKPAERIGIVQACGEMREAAVEALPLLSEAALAAEGDLPRHAATAVTSIAPDDEQLAVQLAQHTLAEVRQIGIAALAAIESPQEQTIVQLQEAVQDEHAKIRETALIALAKSKLPQEVKAEQIEAALLDTAESVRAAALVGIRRAKLYDAAFAQACAEHLSTAEGETALALVKALGAVGPAARSTFGLLVEAADAKALEPSVVADTLAAFGESVVPQLLESIERRPALEPMLAVALAKVGEPAIPALLKGIQNDSQLIRLAATRAVGEVPLLNDELRQVLVSRVGDEDPSIRRVALNALLDRTADNEELRQLVLQSLKDADGVVRSAAVAAISKLGFSREQLQGAISAGLEDGDPGVISQTLLALSDLPAQLSGQRVGVVALVQHEGGDVRQAAIQTLGRLGKDQVDDDVVQAIVRGLEDKDRTVRLTATETARKLGLQHALLVERVANNLTDDVDLLRESLETLASFGPQSDALVQTVGNLLQHEQNAIRSLAIKAVAAIDQQVPRKVEVLRSMLDDGDWEVRRQAGIELGKLGPEAKAAVPRLFELLSSDQDSDYSNQSLEEISAAPVEAVPMLISNLESSERRARFHAMTLLGKIGPAAAEALPKLEEMLEKLADSTDDRDEFRRKRLRETIRAIRPESAEDN